MGTVRERAAGAREGLASCRTAARAHGTSLPRVMRRALRLRYGQGFTAPEALRLGLLDPRLPEPELDRVTSKRRIDQYLRPLNPRGTTPMTEDKAIFYRMCEMQGLPTPALHAVHHRGATGWGAGGVVLADRAAWTGWLGAPPAEELVVKPAHGYWGLGVFVVRWDGEAWVDAHDRSRLTPEELWDRLEAPGPFASHVLQERVRNHADLAPFGTDALHTVRLVTLVESDGSVRALVAGLRLAGPGTVTDNFRAGARGGSMATIDPDTGTVTANAVQRTDGAGQVASDVHPVTGAPVTGLAIPGWGELRRLAERAAIAFLPARAIGWDIAVTPDGPVIIEANRSWDAPNSTRVMHRVLVDLADA